MPHIIYKTRWKFPLLFLVGLFVLGYAQAQETVKMYNFGAEPVKIFKAPKKGAEVLGEIKKDEYVEVKVILNRWAIIDYNGVEAFVEAREIREKVSFKSLFGN
ncbi:MAG: hypothetical protein OEY59_12965 [Deltaproteobacteria bacterium]|nr:hypothetical protein [Deltaproteobacteria bacterium]